MTDPTYEQIKAQNRHFRQALRDRSIQDEIRLGIFYITTLQQTISGQIELLRRALEEYQHACKNDLPKIQGNATAKMVDEETEWK